MAGLPHGLLILAGPPGTGKTTLARGLAQTAARGVATRGATTYIEIDPHAFPSELLGESQRNITTLMTDTIPEMAARRPHTIVLIDEVESFAVRRSTASFGANPVDVHRATDALLAGIDAVAAELPTGAVRGDDELPRRRRRGVSVPRRPGAGTRAAGDRDDRPDHPAQPAGAGRHLAGHRCRWPTTRACTRSWRPRVRDGTADGCASWCCPR